MTKSQQKCKFHNPLRSLFWILLSILFIVCDNRLLNIYILEKADLKGNREEIIFAFPSGEKKKTKKPTNPDLGLQNYSRCYLQETVLRKLSLFP